jgi:hypothetical protein
MDGWLSAGREGRVISAQVDNVNARPKVSEERMGLRVPGSRIEPWGDVPHLLAVLLIHHAEGCPDVACPIREARSTKAGRRKRARR